jgi:folate-binding protein YgfZ
MPSLLHHLSQYDATNVVDGAVRHFGDTAEELQSALKSSAKCPLLSLGLVSISGSDAVDFINGQFTTDCTQLSAEHSQLSGWCDPKGRILFLFVLYRIGDCVFVIIPKAHIPKFQSRLKMYILRADVVVEDASNARSIVGIIGEQAPQDYALAGLQQPWGTMQFEDRAVIRYGFGRSRYLVVESEAHCVDRWESLAQHSVGEDVWTALDAYAGFPRLDEFSQNQFLPQQLNLDQIEGVSFSKGCYPGQEIIARLKYRGEVKKRLRSFSHNSPNDVIGGTRVLDADHERLSGHVLFSQRIDVAHCIASAVIDVGADILSLSLDGYPNVQLQELPLPYPSS